MIGRRMFTAGLLAASSFWPAMADDADTPSPLVDGRLQRRGGIFQFKPRYQALQNAIVSKCLVDGGGSLKYHGGLIINEITYKIIYVGTIWNSNSLNPSVNYIHQKLSVAVSDSTLNAVLPQYFEKNKSISATAKLPKILPYPWKSEISETDIWNMIKSLSQDDQDFPASDDDLKKFAYLFVLPPGTILNGPSNQATPQNSLEGLGGYHDWYPMTNGTKVTPIYFGVVAWADGQNGSAVPGWEPHDNVCAGLYHELAEIRLNPNIDDPNNCNWGWISKDGAEIGDLVIHAVFPDVGAAFLKWTTNVNGVVAPIQMLWANCQGPLGEGTPWNPASAPPACKCLHC